MNEEIVYTQQVIDFTVINGFICDYAFLPGECTMDCDRCGHAEIYASGGHCLGGDRTLKDLEDDLRK